MSQQRRTGLWVAFGAGVLAVVLVVVLVPDRTHERERTTNDETIPVAWSATTDEHVDEHPYESTHRQVWTVDGAVVRAGVNAMQSFDPASGRLNWATPLPPHRRVCGSAYGIGSVAAITYGTIGPDEHRRCDHVLVVDVRTGEITQNIEFDPRTESSPMIDVMGEAVYAALPLQPAAARPYGQPAELRKLDGRTGVAAWRALFDGCHDVNDVMASDARVLVLATCTGVSIGDDVEKLYSVHPDSGAVEWSAPLPESGRLVFFALLSADPPIVANHVSDQDCCRRQRYLVFGDDGQELVTVERGAGDELAAGLSVHWFHRMHTRSFAVVGSTIVTGAWPDASTWRYNREFVGIDLDTGEDLWRARLPYGVVPTLVEPDGAGRLQIFDAAGFTLFDLDVTTGKTTQVAALEDPFDISSQGWVDFFPRMVGHVLVLCPRTAEYATDAMGYRLTVL